MGLDGLLLDGFLEERQRGVGKLEWRGGLGSETLLDTCVKRSTVECLSVRQVDVDKSENETYPILLSVLFTFTRPSNMLNTEHENSSVGNSFSEGIEGKGTELSVMRSEVERLNEKSAREPPTSEIDPEVARA